jgi:hypothetical protein
LSALGLSAAQLPDLAARMPLPDGIKAYPDQPKLTNQEQDGNVDGVREQDIAFIASRPGRFQLPAMRLAWWDTAQNGPREVVLPARTLEVLPGTGGSGSSSPPPVEAAPIAPASASASPATGPTSLLAAPRGMASVWPWVSLVMGLLWLGTLAAWWRARRHGAIVPSRSVMAKPGADSIRAGAARKAFHQSCRDNDAMKARRHLLDWARANWPQDPPAGLNALAQRLQDSMQSGLVLELDRACYAGGDWRGAALAEALADLPGAAGKAERKTSELAALYP